MILVRRLLYYLRSVWTLLSGFENPARVVRAFLPHRGRRPLVLRLRGGGPRFQVRHGMDAWLVKETCLDRDYDRLGIAIEDGWRILDVGAGIGEFAVIAARSSPHGVVHACEPFRGSFAMLLTNIDLNDLGNVRPFEEAVSGAPADLALDLSAGDEARFSTRPAPGTGASPDRAVQRVASTTLREAIGRLPAGRCDLLKLDCEGAEFDIVLTSDDACWTAVDRVVAEYHEEVSTGRAEELAAALDRRGFDVRLRPSRYRRKLGFLVATRRES